MTAENLYKIAKSIGDNNKKQNKTELTIYLDQQDQNSLQQEVYRMKDPTLLGYVQKPIFQIMISNVTFIIKTV